MHELDEEHVHLDGDEVVAYTGDRVVLTSVGVDIGTSTSHVLLSRLTLERQGQRLSSRYAVTEREILYRSPVIFTPYTSSGHIDAEALGAFIARAHEEAGVPRDDVDTGAVITTGEAALRENARSVSELFAHGGGRFVVATAGPNLESLLAAHGSGAADLSRDAPEPLLNIDIGGGTTKFAVCEGGRVTQTAALHLGARLLAWDDAGHLMRLEDAGVKFAQAAGLTTPLALRTRPPAAVLDLLAGFMAETILHAALGASTDDPSGDAAHPGSDEESIPWITPPLHPRVFKRIVFSGGVAEYVYEREMRDFGDLGPRLGDALRRRAAELRLQLLEPVEAIRATCIGASQYTVQLSGDTIFLSDPDILPMRSIPVVAVRGIGHPPTAAEIAEIVRRGIERFDLAAGEDGLFALGVHWHHGADYASLRELCEGIVSALPQIRNGHALVLVLDADVAGIVGALLQQEFGVPGAIVCIDQVLLREFDYIDVGRPLPEQGVVPVVVKSLVFH